MREGAVLRLPSNYRRPLSCGRPRIWARQWPPPLVNVIGIRKARSLSLSRSRSRVFEVTPVFTDSNRVGRKSSSYSADLSVVVSSAGGPARLPSARPAPEELLFYEIIISNNIAQPRGEKGTRFCVRWKCSHVEVARSSCSMLSTFCQKLR